jgi:hypothetical protein
MAFKIRRRSGAHHVFASNITLVLATLNHRKELVTVKLGSYLKAAVPGSSACTFFRLSTHDCSCQNGILSKCRISYEHGDYGTAVEELAYYPAGYLLKPL